MAIVTRRGRKRKRGERSVKTTLDIFIRSLKWKSDYR
jgi:hypothetical protein